MYNISGNPQHYLTMLTLPHPTSAIHPRMAAQNRAAQFAPFEALSGHTESMAETARQTAPKTDLGEDQVQALNRILQFLQYHQEEHPAVTIRCFCPDAKKSGGAYRTLHGHLRSVDHHSLRLLDGQVVPFSRIYDLDCALPFDFM